jgi:hypothetical protein
MDWQYWTEWFKWFQWLLTDTEVEAEYSEVPKVVQVVSVVGNGYLNGRSTLGPSGIRTIGYVVEVWHAAPSVGAIGLPRCSPPIVTASHSIPEYSQAADWV